jgi:hypothetical protein
VESGAIQRSEDVPMVHKFTPSSPSLISSNSKTGLSPHTRPFPCSSPFFPCLPCECPEDDEGDCDAECACVCAWCGCADNAASARWRRPRSGAVGGDGDAEPARGKTSTSML